MNKKTLQIALARLRRVKTWQLVIILIIGLIFSIAFLRMNSLEMDSRRNAVYEADKAGDREEIKQALVELQNYVSAHMNTSLGKGLWIEESFNRDYESALNSAVISQNPNSAVYQQASIECRNRFQGGVASFRNDYVTCVHERVQSLKPQEDLSYMVNFPIAEYYHYNFASPIWSPDLAGFFVLFCLIVTSVIGFRLLATSALRLLLKMRFKS